MPAADFSQNLSAPRESPSRQRKLCCAPRAPPTCPPTRPRPPKQAGHFRASHPLFGKVGLGKAHAHASGAPCPWMREGERDRRTGSRVGGVAAGLSARRRGRGNAIVVQHRARPRAPARSHKEGARGCHERFRLIFRHASAQRLLSLLRAPCRAYCSRLLEEKTNARLAISPFLTAEADRRYAPARGATLLVPAFRRLCRAPPPVVLCVARRRCSWRRGWRQCSTWARVSGRNVGQGQALGIRVHGI